MSYSILGFPSPTITCPGCKETYFPDRGHRCNPKITPTLPSECPGCLAPKSSCVCHQGFVCIDDIRNIWECRKCKATMVGFHGHRCYSCPKCGENRRGCDCHKKTISSLPITISPGTPSKQIHPILSYCKDCGAPKNNCVCLIRVKPVDDLPTLYSGFRELQKTIKEFQDEVLVMNGVLCERMDLFNKRLEAVENELV